MEELMRRVAAFRRAAEALPFSKEAFDKALGVMGGGAAEPRGWYDFLLVSAAEADPEGAYALLTFLERVDSLQERDLLTKQEATAVRERLMGYLIGRSNGPFSTEGSQPGGIPGGLLQVLDFLKQAYAH